MDDSELTALQARKHTARPSRALGGRCQEEAGKALGLRVDPGFWAGILRTGGGGAPTWTLGRRVELPPGPPRT